MPLLWDCCSHVSTSAERRLEQTGIDLLKILGKCLFVVKTDKCMGVFQLFGGARPGWPPKSTPMLDQRTCFLKIFIQGRNKRWAEALSNKSSRKTKTHVNYLGM